MDKQGSKGGKRERIKLRKKLATNTTSLDSSQLDNHVPSDSNITNEDSTKHITEKKRHKLSGKKRKGETVRGADNKLDQLGSHEEDGSKTSKHEKSIKRKEKKKKRKLTTAKREKQKRTGADVDCDQLGAEGEDGSKNSKYKSGRAGKKKKKDQTSSEKVAKAIKEENGSPASEVYQISSVDVDSSKGMKKWISEYYQRRPGLKTLQERIDELITSYEKQEEDARKVRDELIAEEGWTVVVHQKGRKKTTDAESGTTVGSVAQAAVVDNLGKKKSKEVGLNFYRFQKREAQRNEIMMLQSKFEQDKKRIQQLRAARKFRPY